MEKFKPTIANVPKDISIYIKLLDLYLLLLIMCSNTIKKKSEDISLTKELKSYYINKCVDIIFTIEQIGNDLNDKLILDIANHYNTLLQGEMTNN